MTSIIYVIDVSLVIYYWRQSSSSLTSVYYFNEVILLLLTSVYFFIDVSLLSYNVNSYPANALREHYQTLPGSPTSLCRNPQNRPDDVERPARNVYKLQLVYFYRLTYPAQPGYILF